MDRVALLRGVNVGGGNKVAMADLRALAEGLGWRDVRSYLASGNLVFRAKGQPDVLTGALRDAMRSGMGVDVPVLVLDGAAVRDSLEQCPFVPDDPRQVHVAYLFGDPAPDWALYETHAAVGDGLRVAGRVAWLHTPGGFGRSKLAARLGRIVGADLTARNLRTVAALVDMLER